MSGDLIISLAIALVAVFPTLAFWIGFRLGRRERPVPPPPLPSPPSALLARAGVLTQQAQVDGGSGEAKRHRVYAQLIKEYPTIPRRIMSRVIERALGD
jgi:hypothetical protein